jgi:Tol biopolymer transport system component/DNA-binding winged helix-turn-helix (wHTH) protein
MTANGFIQFEEYEIDRARWLLSWRGEPLALNRKTFDLLLYLADRADRVVGKEELLRALWPESFVEESNLTQHIFLLRKALSRHESGSRIIETVPGRGYRFAAALSAMASPSPPLVPPPAPTPAPKEDRPVQNHVLIRATESVTRITVEEELQEEDEPLPAAIPAALPEAPRLGGGFPPRHSRRRNLLWSIAAAAVVAAAVALALRLRPSRPRIVAAVQLTNDGVPKSLNLATDGVAFDGSRLIFTERRDNQSRIADVPIQGGEVRSTPAPVADAEVTDYSRVNRTMLIGSAWRTDDERPILAETAPGTPPRRIGELTGHEAVWSPDARQIAVARGRFLYVADADGSNERRLVSANGVVYALKWSPDGRTISFTENLGGNENRLWAVDATGANLRRMMADTPDGNHLCCGVWSADGRNFYYIVQGIVANSIWVVPDGGRKSNLGTLGGTLGGILSRTFGPTSPTRLTVGLGDYWRAPLPSPDGRALWAIGSHLRGELTRVDPATRQLRPFLGGVSAEGASFSPDRSPDGAWVAYTAYPEGTLWRSRPDGGEKRQLTQPPLVARFPQWSPDGRTIAFLGSESGETWRIYLMPASGGKPQPLLVENASQGVPTWSPDGKQIAFGRLLDFGSERDPNLTIEIYDLDRRSHKTLHGSDGLWTARWSPDGRYLSAVTEDNRVLRLCDMRTQQWTDLADLGVNDVIWSPDSRYLYFDTVFGGDPALYRVPVETRKLERWADLRGFPRGGFYSPWLGIAPDGAPLLLKDTSIEEIYRLDLANAN